MVVASDVGAFFDVSASVRDLTPEADGALSGKFVDVVIVTV